MDRLWSIDLESGSRANCVRRIHSISKSKWRVLDKSGLFALDLGQR